MSEFKFACPICGQHITADSSTSGGRLDCPTCFRRIVVPQAPSVGETKLILSASQAPGPRPPPLMAGTGARARAPRPLWQPVVLLILVSAGAAALGLAGRSAIESISSRRAAAARAPTSPVPGPEDAARHVQWTLDLKNTAIPGETAAGTVHGMPFVCEKAVLQGGHLSLRQGRGERPYLRVGIFLYARQPADLAGKTVYVAPDREPPLPRIALKWRDDQHRPMRGEFDSGYALKLSFGQPANGRMPGQIYVCLPDEFRSVVAGSFEAEIKNPTAEDSALSPANPRPAPGRK